MVHVLDLVLHLQAAFLTSPYITKLVLGFFSMQVLTWAHNFIFFNLLLLISFWGAVLGWLRALWLLVWNLFIGLFCIFGMLSLLVDMWTLKTFHFTFKRTVLIYWQWVGTTSHFLISFFNLIDCLSSYCRWSRSRYRWSVWYWPCVENPQ